MVIVCSSPFWYNDEMLKDKFHICEAFGIPITADASSAILLLLIVLDLGLPLGVPCAILLAVSIVLHELAHSLTTKAFGGRIAEIRLSLLGGCASGDIPRQAWQELLMAAAGPAMSFLLGFGTLFAVSGVPIESAWLEAVVTYVVVMNVMLGAFNLLPGFPMDGGRIFRCVMRAFMNRAKATYWAMLVGRVSAVALVLLPFLGINHIWIIPIGGSFFLRVLIAWMIWQEGYREYLYALEEERFSSWSQADFNARVSPPPYDR